MFVYGVNMCKHDDIRGFNVNMTDAPFSVRLDRGTRDRLGILVEQSGTTAKEFISHMVASYEKTQVRESVASQEFDQLKHHLARIEEIYITLIKTGQDKNQANAEIIAKLEQEVIQAKAAAQDATEKAEVITQEAQTQIETMQARTEQIQETAEKEVWESREALKRAQEAQEQAAKLATLAEEAAAAAKTKAEELEALAGQAEEYRQENERLSAQIVQLQEDTKKALEAEKRAQSDLKAALDAQVMRAKEVLQNATERAEVEKEKAVLAAQRKDLEKIGDLQNTIGELVKEKSALEVEMAKMAGNQENGRTSN